MKPQSAQRRGCQAWTTQFIFCFFSKLARILGDDLSPNLSSLFGFCDGKIVKWSWHLSACARQIKAKLASLLDVCVRQMQVAVVAVGFAACWTCSFVPPLHGLSLCGAGRLHIYM